MIPKMLDYIEESFFRKWSNKKEFKSTLVMVVNLRKRNSVAGSIIERMDNKKLTKKEKEIISRCATRLLEVQMKPDFGGECNDN